MELTSPLVITSRLLPGLHIRGPKETWGQLLYSISIEQTDETDRRGKPLWRWFIDIDSNEYSATDLAGGGDARTMLGSLLSFLLAAVESYQHSGMEGENSDLFPKPVLTWALEYHSELQTLALELEEGTE